MARVFLFTLHQNLFVLTASEKNTLLIVDDHRVVSCGLQHLISQSLANVEKIDVATSGEEALGWIAACPYDLYILDVELPDMSGIDLVDRIRELNPEARFIIHTMHDELWYYRRMEASEVDGIVFKSSDTHEIIAAIGAVLQGKHFLCQRAKQMHAASEKRRSRSGQDLSERELLVLQYIARGLNTAEIAEELCISINTVETHRRHLNDKLDATNVATLIMNAVSKGLLPIH